MLDRFQLGSVKGVLVVVSLMALLAACSSNKTVYFQSTEEIPTSIRGYLSKPEGAGPFPAVMLLHGCSGLERDQRPPAVWRGLIRHAGILVDEGYTTLIVDSHGSRGISTREAWTHSCRSGRGFRVRVDDVYGAIAYLEGLPYVRNGAIGAVGLSQGGSVILDSMRVAQDEVRTGSLAAGVAFYPHCASAIIGVIGNPLLILIGDSDDITEAAPCKELLADNKRRASERGLENHLELVIYPAVHHSFDLPISGTHQTAIGTVSGDTGALRDATERMLDFFRVHLKN